MLCRWAITNDKARGYKDELNRNHEAKGDKEMRMYHEIYPNKIPILITARLDNDDQVVKESIKIHPIVNIDSRPTILEPLPFENVQEILPRIEKYKDL